MKMNAEQIENIVKLINFIIISLEKKFDILISVYYLGVELW